MLYPLSYEGRRSDCTAQHEAHCRPGWLPSLTTMIQNTLRGALHEALVSAGLPVPDDTLPLDVPRQREHGDWSSPVALTLARTARRPPREIAAAIKQALDAADRPWLARVEVAGPGHLNFFLDRSWLGDVLRAVVAEEDRFGTSDTLAGDRVNLEFVSANPTGPLHAGGGRWVVVGDVIANLLAAQGAAVHREYYLNDAGAQLGKFRESLAARYREEQPPEDGYQGQYLVEMAQQLRAELGDDVDGETACEWGYRTVVAGLQADLGRIGVHFDTWFSERTLHERGDVERVIDDLDARGVTYEHDGAKWLRATDFGDTRDRVIVRSDGTTTYLCNDFAYHRDKLARGFTHLIDIWGADHHGQVRSLHAGMAALGYPPGEPEILLGQFVKLVQHGKEVRLSKRTGNIIALADILDEVDPDVARMVFLLQGIDSAQTFDLDVVTAQSMENPVYYVQYAHARIASIGRKAAAAGVVRRPLETVDLSRLTHEREEELLRALAIYPQVVTDAAATRAPQKLTTWVRDFARGFHGFYRDCRVLSDDEELTQARLWLTEASRIGFANALAVLGVHAPDEMARLDDDGNGQSGAGAEGNGAEGDGA
jgi:arginyl-tRNA synthetase